jgi:hypothetical protein
MAADAREAWRFSAQERINSGRLLGGIQEFLFTVLMDPSQSGYYLKEMHERLERLSALPGLPKPVLKPAIGDSVRSRLLVKFILSTQFFS